MRSKEEVATGSRRRSGVPFLLALFVFCGAAPGGSCAPPPTLALTRITVSPEASRPNLLDNSGFEDAGADGLPGGWVWDKRNTTATATLDQAHAHQGRRSLLLTNATPEGANVYGLMTHSKPIHLQAGSPYTLSAYVRSAAPGDVWIGGGSDWQFRLRLPSTLTLYRWRRIQLTFVPGPADADFILRVGTDSPTSGVWIEDLKLEQGGTATPDAPSGVTPQFDPATSVGDAVTEGDGPWSVSFDLILPRPLSGAQVEAIVQGSPGGNPHPILDQPLAEGAGTWRLTVQGTSNGVDAAPRAVTLRVSEASHEIARGETLVRFFSPARGEIRLAALRRRLPVLEALLRAVRAKGQDDAYPLVSVTVLQNFVGYVEEDLHSHEVSRALQQLDELEAMDRRVERELRAALVGRRLPDVPRWTGQQRPRVVGPSFLAPVVYPARQAAPVERPVFFVGYGHFGQVRRDIEKFPNYGANIIQIEVGPRAVFPQEGMISDSAIRETRAVLDRAAKAGVAVNLLISPHYMPEWMLNKYPDMRIKQEGFLKFCLHAPEGQAFLKRYIAALLPPLGDSPSLHSICLSNEPVSMEEPDPFGAQDWHAWLQKRHEDIATLNGLWGTHYATLDDIPLPNPLNGGSPDAPRPSPLWLEYVRFNQEFFAGWHQMLADAVHDAAPGLPVHAKAMTWSFLNDGAARFGVDTQLFGAMSDINGNDSAESYSYGHGDFAQDFVPSEEAYDLQRSVRDTPVFNSENHVINDRETRPLPPEHLRALLWQGALHGQSATTLWVWERTSDPKSDFYGNVLHHPAAVEAVGRVCHDLNRLAPEVTTLQRLTPQVVLLQSVTASVWDEPAYTDCMLKLYTALSFTGLPLGFVTERQLESGLLPKAPLLLVPNVTHLSDAAFAALRRYSGRVVFVGTGSLGRDDYDHPRAETLTAGPPIPFHSGATSWQDLWQAMPAALVSAHIQPILRVRDGVGRLLSGVEWRCANTPQGVVVSLCNYRQTPVSLTFWQPSPNGIPPPASPGQPPTHGMDLFSGEPLSQSGTEAHPIRLQPLEIGLYLFPKFQVSGVESDPKESLHRKKRGRTR